MFTIKCNEITLQVARDDFPEEMSWKDAKNACKSLGRGWRLPTTDELKVMYGELHKKGQGNFRSTYYWSSREYSATYPCDGAMRVNFAFLGIAYGVFKSEVCSVRAVLPLFDAYGFPVRETFWARIKFYFLGC